MSIERMCAGKEFQVEGADTEKARGEKLLVIPAGLVRRLYTKNVRIWTEDVRNEFREVERLRGMKCFRGGETSMHCLVSTLSEG